MKVEAHPRPPGDHRFEYEVRWQTLALPLYLGLSRSWFPRSKEATTEFNDRHWQPQLVLIVRVLFFTMRVVLDGPLFLTDEVDPG